MRILYVAPNIQVPGTNGGSAHVTGVVRGLRARNDVLLVARRGSTEPGCLAIGFGAGAVVRHALPALYLPRVLAAARRFAPDVVYERYSAFGLGVVVARLLGVPSAVMVLDRDASPVSLALADRIVATSDAFLAPRHRTKLREVRWGVDPERFARSSGAEVRARLAPHGERLVVYAGSFHDWHGLDVLVEVAAQWSGPPVVIALVGDGDAAPRIRRLVASRGVGARVVLVGRVDHTAIPEYLVAADACVAPYAPSRHPIFRKHGMDRDPLKVLEYMAAGRPSVTIDTPRMRTLFREGEEVVLYRPEDAASLGAALRGLLDEPERAARIAAAGERLVRERYTWAGHARALEAIFEEAIAERCEAGARRSRLR